jgi:hypothetical protein
MSLCSCEGYTLASRFYSTCEGIDAQMSTGLSAGEYISVCEVFCTCRIAVGHNRYANNIYADVLSLVILDNT